MTTSQNLLRFLDYVLDPAAGQVRHGTDRLSLRPKTLAVLAYLAAHADRLVTKRELLDAVWPDTAVTDWVLTSCIRELREAFGDDARRPRVIETVHGRGYRFVAAIAPAASARAVSSAVAVPVSTALVGRRVELETLDGWWQRALAGERQVGFVIGEAGMGKTALVDEWCRLLIYRLLVVGSEAPNSQTTNNPTTCLLARGQCIEQRGAGEPYLPVLEALGRLCTESGSAAVVDVMRRHAPAWLVQLPGLLEPAECEALERRLGATTRERMLREMAALVAALPLPLVFVLEDLHWSDHATLDLVATLAQRRDPARLLLIGTYRPVEATVRNHPLRAVHQDLRARGRCQDLWLRPLTAPATVEYLCARWPALAAADTLGAAVHQRTDGNPLFLVNLADYLEATGAVVRAAGGWDVQGDPSGLAEDVPPGLRQLIAAQIERLGDGERGALEAASLAGRSFSAALVAAAIAGDVVEIEDRLAGLAHSGMMVSADGTSAWPDGTVAGTYRFNHALYQSVFRDRVPPARRRQLHERLAVRLEQAYTGHTADVSRELALHFEAGGDAARAVPYLEEAAIRFIRRGANREAIALLEQGLAILDALPATPERQLRTIRLCMGLGPALVPVRGYGAPEIERLYERARQLSEERNDPVQLFQALIGLTGTYLSQGRLDRARGTAQQLQQALLQVPLPAFEFAGSLFVGMVTYHTGSLAAAHAALTRALTLGEVPLPALSLDMQTMALGYRTMVLVHQGLPDQARHALVQTTERAMATERPFDRSFATQIACFVHVILRDFERLAQAAEQAVAFDDFPAIAAFGRFSHGRVLAARGDHGRAVETMRDTIEAYRAAGQGIALPLMLAALAEGHAAAGDTVAALAGVAEARTAAEAAGEIRYLAELDRIEGDLHAARGDTQAAERCLRRAIAVARAQGARWWALRATTSLARLALQPGRRRASRAELARVVESFDEGADTEDLQEARRLAAAAPER